MTILRCTKKLLKEIGAPPTDIREFSGLGLLGSWHANIFRIEKHKAIIFTNDKTLYSFVVAGVKRKDIRRIDEMFREQLFRTLKSKRIDVSRFNQVMDETIDIVIGKTNSRTILGSMNDHVATTIYHVAYDGGYEHLDINDINERLNDTPMKGIGYSHSEKELIELLGAT